MSDKTVKIIKIVSCAQYAAIIVLMVVFGCVMTSRGKKLKSANAELECVRTECDSLKALNLELAKMSAITCSVSFEMRNNAVLGVNSVRASQIAEQVAVYTRDELKHLTDSINGVIRQI